MQHQAKMRFAKQIPTLLTTIPPEVSTLSEGIILVRYHYELPNKSMYGPDTILRLHTNSQVCHDATLQLPRLEDLSVKELMSFRSWRDDRLVGEDFAYFPNGKLNYHRNWDNDGLLDGEEKIYFENGVLQAQNFRKAGVLEGVQQAWYDSGHQCFIRFWHHGQREGTEKHWSKQGQLTSTMFWKRGKLRSTVTNRIK
jgi:hypothetical protein